MECESMLFVKKPIPYLWDLSNSFSTASLIFTAVKLFHEVIYFIQVVAKCLHFVMPYMKQNKNHKQTLESAQYGLESSFNMHKSSRASQPRWGYLSHSRFLAVTCKKFVFFWLYNKHFFCQDGWILASFFLECLWISTMFQAINTLKKRAGDLSGTLCSAQTLLHLKSGFR